MADERNRRHHYETRYRAGRLLGMQSDQNVESADAAEIRQRLYRLLAAPDVEETGLPGCVITEYKRCGRPGCRCGTGQLHGPYYYWYGRSLGHTWKKYLKRAEAPRVVALCRLYRDRRWTRAKTRALLRDFKRSMRQLDLALDLLGDDW